MSISASLGAGIVTAPPAETRAIAHELAAALPPDIVLALHGDLGVGKTTFVQGLAAGFGCPDPVTSPTFTIYTLHQGGRRTLVHLDAYRLDTGAQIDSLMLEDFLVRPYCLAVEWPVKIADWFPSEAWHLELGITADEHHTLRLLA